MEIPTPLPALETIDKDTRPVLTNLIELTRKTAHEYSKSPKTTLFKIKGMDPLYLMAAGMNLQAWQSSTVKPSELLEKALALPPESILAGFRFDDNYWPICDKSLAEGKKLKVLDETQTREIYLALGGDRTKADQMFPTPPPVK